MKPYPFHWNGLNYLTKMGCDLDFLTDTYALQRYYGFSLFHNPLIVPGRSSQPSWVQPHSPATTVLLKRPASRGGTTSRSSPRRTSARPGTAPANEDKAARPRSPYLAAPAATAPARSSNRHSSRRGSSRGGGGGSDSQGGEQEDGAEQGLNATATLRNSPRDPRIPGGWPPGIGPSEVAGVSMQRVREAAAVLNEEQHVYGAHFLDQFGRLLPIRPHRRRRRAVRKPKPKLETKEENQRRLSTLYGVDYDLLQTLGKRKGGTEGDGDSLASSGTGASAAEGEGEEEEEEAQPSPEQERGAVGEAAAEVVEEIVAAVMDARQQQADAEEEERQQKTQAVRGNVSILGALGNAMGKGFGALGDFRGGGGSMRSMK